MTTTTPPTERCALDGCGLPLPDGGGHCAVIAPVSARATAPHYCSPTCMAQSSRRTAFRSRVCVECGHQFEISPTVAGTTCSAKCAKAVDARIARAWQLMEGSAELPTMTSDNAAGLAADAERFIDTTRDLAALGTQLKRRQRKGDPIDAAVAQRHTELRSTLQERAGAVAQALERAQASEGREEVYRTNAEAGRRRWEKGREAFAAAIAKAKNGGTT